MGVAVGRAPVAGLVGREAAQPPVLALARRVETRICIAMLLAHGLGAFHLFALMFFVLPGPEGVALPAVVWPNVAALAAYGPLAFLLGMRFGRRLSAANAAWVREGRAPTPAERDAVLRAPLRCVLFDAGLWLGGLVLFTAVNLQFSADVAAHVALTIGLGGISTCAVAYLLTERIMQPVTAAALQAGPPPQPIWPGIQGRLVLAWLSATGVPLIGLLCVAVHGLQENVPARELAVSVLILGVIAVALGLFVTVLVARTVADPVLSVRRALARVEAGDLGPEVQVTDGSEVGMLQAGFNRMVSGLRERDRMRSLYSSQVGEEVARFALDGAPALGGEVRDVAVLFVDLVGSTAFAAGAPPEAVVDRLNRFFAIVVEVMEDHGGWVNKFEGDAALCVFGAPVPAQDCSARALAAARDLRARLARELPGVDAGIGLSAGEAVAGWVGAERRFEYTVIGDPVNEASRLCELAKRRLERLLASEAILERAGAGESRFWRLGALEHLRGRPHPTRLALPAS